MSIIPGFFSFRALEGVYYGGLCVVGQEHEREWLRTYNILLRVQLLLFDDHNRT